MKPDMVKSFVNKLFLILFLFCNVNLNAQEKKTVEALSISKPLVIDGVLDEDVYKLAQPARDFVQLMPYNGKPSFQPSEVYFFYDQAAVYVGAMLYDKPDSIFNLFTQRDEIGMSDYFGVYIDPYNEGQLAYGFFITPAGIQTDIKASKSNDGDSEDGAWDAVWESKTRITDKGWVVEMRIPYSALRFPEKDVHTWGLNMWRNIRRYNSNNSWNFVDRKVAGFIHQSGQLTGIKNIAPPVRLSLSPYAATYLDYKDGSSSPKFIYKGGLDAKYGLSESFTLDMMLIPDFGQIQSDDQQLNLSPYELYFNEKRQFFNEGIELFQRGDIFYSRRIGTSPKFYEDLNDNEVVDFRPSETQLVNATKISGRTQSGWGIGFLNAMSLPSYSTILDTVTGNKHDELVQPFTNYNVSVIDKTLKNNGYFSIINTNMYMFNNPFRANVTATDFQFRNKAKTYAFKGKGGLSIRGAEEKETGYLANFAFTKNSGKFQYTLSQNIISDTYNPNDMGYIRRNNEVSSAINLAYHIFEPFWVIKEWHTYAWEVYRRMYSPNDFYGHEYGIETSILLKNNYNLYANVCGESNRHEYYDTRVKGRYYFEPYYFNGTAQISTDSRKPINGYLNFGGFKHPGLNRYGTWGDIGINVRIGQRIQLGYGLSYNNKINNIGFVDKNSNEDTIWLADRDIKTFSNVVECSYAMTNKASIRLRVRHYWSGALNKFYFQLQKDGTLRIDNAYNKNNDENFNAFNIDLGFRWIFAPGSELTLAWKNSIYDQRNVFTSSYRENINLTWNSKQTNTFSLKVLYYIDYNNLRKKKHKPANL
jgi:hypothetical protein